MRTHSFLATVLAGVLLACFSVVSGAQECPRGTLDEQYCDRDADLVADFACIRKKSSMHPIPNCLLRYLFQLGDLGHCEEVFHDR